MKNFSHAPARRLGFASAVVLALLLPAGAAVPTNGSGATATIHPLATEAAIDAMRRGGNAIDAAIAAGLTLGVVDTHNSGIGGGCFLLIRRADGSVHAIDGRERAPAAATRDLFVRAGKADPTLSQAGALAIGVPGALAAYDEAARRHGRQPLAEHLRAAARIAGRGFPLSKTYADRLAATASELAQFPESRRVFLRADGTAWPAGHVFVQPELAKVYLTLAQEGAGWFYGGRFAEMTAGWMRENGGLLTVPDFKNYSAQSRETVRTTYRGREIIGFPPPSSGGVHVAQILNILERFDLKSMGAGSADFVHAVTEAMKLAFADRAFWLGDPDFAPVPRGLVSRDYADKLAAKIDRTRASPPPPHGTPENAATDVFGKHTTHFSTADDEGNWVACTATINTSFGSKVVIPGTGVVMNNEMDDFAIQPGVKNYFGLAGAEANAVAAGKRPLSSMSPTLVLQDGAPILSVGAAGGPTIISQTLLTILYVIDFGMPLEKALAQPRFHHQGQPDELRVEKRLPEGVRRELERRGHSVRVVDALGVTQAVARDGATGAWTAVADPRGEGTGKVF